MGRAPTNTIGGGRDQTAVIGHAPEHRDWTPNMPSWEPFIADAVRIEAYVTIDAGMKAPTFIGARTWLMKHCHIGHDAVIGADCELSPGVVVCGHASIGARTRVGVNACVLPGVRVGTDVVIGAGAVVTKNIPAGETWTGNPARNLHEPVEDCRVNGRVFDYDAT